MCPRHFDNPVIQSDFRVEDLRDDGHHDNGGNKIRSIGYHLDGLFLSAASDLVVCQNSAGSPYVLSAEAHTRRGRATVWDGNSMVEPADSRTQNLSSPKPYCRGYSPGFAGNIAENVVAFDAPDIILRTPDSL